MTYIPNPKLEGSNIVACVPQDGFCPIGCGDCFFNRPGNYLGEYPKANVSPIESTKGKIVRVNDVNDSNIQRARVLGVTRRFVDKFYNTSRPCDTRIFTYPVVFTANPNEDEDCYKIEIHPNLMFVRAKVNAWNQQIVDEIIDYYTSKNVPVVLTFMAYYEKAIPFAYQKMYEYKKRIINSSWVLKPEAWWEINDRYYENSLVHTCGIAPHSHLCRDCGNCEQFYIETIRRLGLPSAFIKEEI